MGKRENIIREIQALPPYFLNDLEEFIDYLKHKKKYNKRPDITIASEKSLAKDWFRPEEDEAWQDL